MSYYLGTGHDVDRFCDDSRDARGRRRACGFSASKRRTRVSVFEPLAVDPPLTETEVLECFRAGSTILECAVAAIEKLGMQIEIVERSDVLPERLRQAHREIRPGPQMSRDQFKKALKELEL